MIGGGIGKTARWLLALLIFPLLVAILPVKYPYTLTIISIGAPLVLLIVVGHGGCCKIFGICKIRFLVTHSESSFGNFLGGFPPEPFTFDLQSFCIWHFLSHLRQVISDLANYPPPEPLPFPLRKLSKSTFFKALLVD